MLHAMVSGREQSGQWVIVARPNQSATWRTNKLVLIALSVPSLGIAIGFALAGAWPILPFAGLELTALGGALYYVNWKLQYRQVITIEAEQVRIDKGFYLPRQSWRLSRDDTRILVEGEQHPWDGPGIALHDRRKQVPVGEFLNRDDCLELLRLLRAQLRVGGHSTRGELRS